MKQHPERFAAHFATGLASHGVPTYFRLYKLGWLDTPIHPLAIVLHTIALLLLASGSRAETTLMPRWPAALAAFGSLFAVSLSLHIWCSPVGGFVDAVHGRYLLPLLPAAMFLAPRLSLSERMQRTVFIFAAAGMTPIAFITVFLRYWVP